MMLIMNQALSWFYIWQIDQYWSIIDVTDMFCETDSESAENLEAEVSDDADHDHAKGFCKIIDH